MADTSGLKMGDRCPACDGIFRAAKAPTAAEREAAGRRENAVALPAHYDTASAEFRAEHGALFVCTTCGYKTRFPVADAAKSEKAAPAEV
jgi:hypothetical protein